jgi:hypothetical protein
MTAPALDVAEFRGQGAGSPAVGSGRVSESDMFIRTGRDRTKRLLVGRSFECATPCPTTPDLLALLSGRNRLSLRPPVVLAGAHHLHPARLRRAPARPP